MTRPGPTSLPLLLFCAAACSVQGTYVPPGPDEPAAVARGDEKPTFSFLDPLSSYPETDITKVDGDTTTQSAWDGYPTEVRVRPGFHTLGVTGRVYVNGNVIASGSSAVAGEFFEGEVYRVKTLLMPGGGVRFELVRETEGEQ